MPAPKRGESLQKYVSRYMASMKARKHFTDPKQRAAVAYSEYRQAHKK